MLRTLEDAGEGVIRHAGLIGIVIPACHLPVKGHICVP